MLVFPNFATISNPEYCIEWYLSETEPLEDIVQRFEHGGHASAMTMLSRVAKVGTSQVRQLPRMRSQTQDVEDVIKVFAAEKQNDEKITEDKKIEMKKSEKEEI